MNDPLVIVGAGGHGRETAQAFVECFPARNFLGFLDDSAVGCTPEGWEIIGPVSAWRRHADAEFLVAVNDPRGRRDIVGRMSAGGGPRWATFVHRGVSVHQSTRIGPGSMVLAGAQVTVSVSVGAHVIVNRGAQVGHDCRLGDFVSVMPAAVLSGGVHVGEGASIGSGATVRQGVRIGPSAVLGMGAAAVSDLEAGMVHVGVPARILRRAEGTRA